MQEEPELFLKKVDPKLQKEPKKEVDKSGLAWKMKVASILSAICFVIVIVLMVLFFFEKIQAIVAFPIVIILVIANMVMINKSIVTAKNK